MTDPESPTDDAEDSSSDTATDTASDPPAESQVDSPAESPANCHTDSGADPLAEPQAEGCPGSAYRSTDGRSDGPPWPPLLPADVHVPEYPAGPADDPDTDSLESITLDDGSLVLRDPDRDGHRIRSSHSVPLSRSR